MLGTPWEPLRNPVGPPTEPPWNPLWTPGGTPCARALPDAEYEPPPNDRKPMQAQLDNHQSPEWNLPKVPARGGLVAWQCLCPGRGVCVCFGRASNNDARYTQEQNKLHAVRPAIGARAAGDATPVAREAAQQKSLTCGKARQKKRSVTHWRMRPPFAWMHAATLGSKFRQSPATLKSRLISSQQPFNLAV